MPIRGPSKKPTARKKANAIGANTYIGRPCKKGHDGKRYTGSMDCVECARQYRKAYISTKPATEGEGSARYDRSKARSYLLKAQSGRCAYCGIWEGVLFVDYITPLNQCGTDTLGNMQLLCKPHYFDKRRTRKNDAQYRKIEGIPASTPWDAI